MSLIQINRNPSRKHLLQFAGIWFPAFWGLVGAMVYFKAGLPSMGLMIWGVASAVALVGLLKPDYIRPIFIGMSLATAPIGWVISFLLLTFFYYIVITPIGVILRLLGKDSISRYIDRSSGSYWVERCQSVDLDRYFHQF